MHKYYIIKCTKQRTKINKTKTHHSRLKRLATKLPAPGDGANADSVVEAVPASYITDAMLLNIVWLGLVYGV